MGAFSVLPLDGKRAALCAVRASRVPSQRFRLPLHALGRAPTRQRGCRAETWAVGAAPQKRRSGLCSLATSVTALRRWRRCGGTGGPRTCSAAGGRTARRTRCDGVGDGADALVEALLSVLPFSPHALRVSSLYSIFTSSELPVRDRAAASSGVADTNLAAARRQFLRDQYGTMKGLLLHLSRDVDADEPSEAGLAQQQQRRWTGVYVSYDGLFATRAADEDTAGDAFAPLYILHPRAGEDGVGAVRRARAPLLPAIRPEDIQRSDYCYPTALAQGQQQPQRRAHGEHKDVESAQATAREAKDGEVEDSRGGGADAWLQRLHQRRAAVSAMLVLRPAVLAESLMETSVIDFGDDFVPPPPPPPLQLLSSQSRQGSDPVDADVRDAQGPTGSARVAPSSPSAPPTNTFTPQMLVPTLPTFFVRAREFLATLPAGYTVAHLQHIFGGTGCVDLVALHGNSGREDFIRLHGGRGRVDFGVRARTSATDEDSALAAHLRWHAAFAPDPFLCDAFTPMLPVPMQWRTLRELVEFAPPHVRAALHPFLYEQSLLFFAQTQHRYQFSAENGGCVCRLGWLDEDEESGAATVLADAPTPSEGALHAQATDMDATTLADGRGKRSRRAGRGFAQPVRDRTASDVGTDTPTLPCHVVSLTWSPPSLRPETTPLPVVVAELVSLLQEKRSVYVRDLERASCAGETSVPRAPCVKSRAQDPGLVLSDYAKRQILLYFGTLRVFLSCHASAFVCAATASSTSTSTTDAAAASRAVVCLADGGTAHENGSSTGGSVAAPSASFPQAAGRPAPRTLEEKLEKALARHDRRAARKARRQLALQSCPDTPYADPQVLLDAVIRFLPPRRAVSLRYFLKALPTSLADYLPDVPLNLFRSAAPHKVQLFEWRRRGHLYLLRPGVPLPSGKLRDDFTDDELLSIVVNELERRATGAAPSEVVSTLAGRLSYGTRVSLGAASGTKGLVRFLQRFPQYFMVVFPDAVRMDSRQARVTLIAAPPLAGAGTLRPEHWDAAGTPPTAAELAAWHAEDADAMSETGPSLSPLEPLPASTPPAARTQGRALSSEHTLPAPENTAGRPTGSAFGRPGRTTSA